VYLALPHSQAHAQRAETPSNPTAATTPNREILTADELEDLLLSPVAEMLGAPRFFAMLAEPENQNLRTQYSALIQSNPNLANAARIGAKFHQDYVKHLTGDGFEWDQEWRINLSRALLQHLDGWPREITPSGTHEVDLPPWKVRQLALEEVMNTFKIGLDEALAKTERLGTLEYEFYTATMKRLQFHPVQASGKLEKNLAKWRAAALQRLRDLRLRNLKQALQIQRKYHPAPITLYRWTSRDIRDQWRFDLDPFIDHLEGFDQKSRGTYWDSIEFRLHTSTQKNFFRLPSFDGPTALEQKGYFDKPYIRAIPYAAGHLQFRGSDSVNGTAIPSLLSQLDFKIANPELAPTAVWDHLFWNHLLMTEAAQRDVDLIRATLVLEQLPEDAEIPQIRAKLQALQTPWVMAEEKKIPGITTRIASSSAGGLSDAVAQIYWFGLSRHASYWEAREYAARSISEPNELVGFESALKSGQPKRFTWSPKQLNSSLCARDQINRFGSEEQKRAVSWEFKKEVTVGTVKVLAALGVYLTTLVGVALIIAKAFVYFFDPPKPTPRYSDSQHKQRWGDSYRSNPSPNSNGNRQSPRQNDFSNSEPVPPVARRPGKGPTSTSSDPSTAPKENPILFRVQSPLPPQMLPIHFDFASESKTYQLAAMPNDKLAIFQIETVNLMKPLDISLQGRGRQWSEDRMAFAIPSVPGFRVSQVEAFAEDLALSPIRNFTLAQEPESQMLALVPHPQTQITRFRVSYSLDLDSDEINGNFPRITRFTAKILEQKVWALGFTHLAAALNARASKQRWIGFDEIAHDIANSSEFGKVENQGLGDFPTLQELKRFVTGGRFVGGPVERDLLFRALFLEIKKMEYLRANMDQLKVYSVAGLLRDPKSAEIRGNRKHQHPIVVNPEQKQRLVVDPSLRTPNEDPNLRLSARIRMQHPPLKPAPARPEGTRSALSPSQTSFVPVGQQHPSRPVDELPSEVAMRELVRRLEKRRLELQEESARQAEEDARIRAQEVEANRLRAQQIEVEKIDQAFARIQMVRTHIIETLQDMNLDLKERDFRLLPSTRLFRLFRALESYWKGKGSIERLVREVAHIYPGLERLYDPSTGEEPFAKWFEAIRKMELGAVNAAQRVANGQDRAGYQRAIEPTQAELHNMDVLGVGYSAIIIQPLFRGTYDLAPIARLDSSVYAPMRSRFFGGQSFIDDLSLIPWSKGHRAHKGELEQNCDVNLTAAAAD